MQGGITGDDLYEGKKKKPVIEEDEEEDDLFGDEEEAEDTEEEDEEDAPKKKKKASREIENVEEPSRKCGGQPVSDEIITVVDDAIGAFDPRTANKKQIRGLRKALQILSKTRYPKKKREKKDKKKKKK